MFYFTIYIKISYFDYCHYFFFHIMKILSLIFFFFLLVHIKTNYIFCEKQQWDFARIFFLNFKT